MNPLLILIFVLTFASPAQADAIWFDADGNSHYLGSEADEPLPTEHRSNAGSKTAQGAPGEKSKAATAHVDLYVTSWCPYCKKAILFLRSHNIPFNEYDIEQDFDAADRKEKLARDYKGVPLAVINGIVIRGFSEASYRQALAAPQH